jgi:hypothetical protein
MTFQITYDPRFSQKGLTGVSEIHLASIFRVKE